MVSSNVKRVSLRFWKFPGLGRILSYGENDLIDRLVYSLDRGLEHLGSFSKLQRVRNLWHFSGRHLLNHKDTYKEKHMDNQFRPWLNSQVLTKLTDLGLRLVGMVWMNLVPPVKTRAARQNPSRGSLV